ncbi:MAG: hypothetical protein NWE83_02015 [Candidatus Bathyarchaeota archaeon]|nr:hypothetical protein [Candidatus Bathyarchaeota archaeon]
MDEAKIEINVHPIKKLVIFECTEFTSKVFFEKVQFIAMAGEPIAINWAKGMVFLYMPYQPESDVIIKEMLTTGTIYWGSLIYAKMPNYQAMKKFGAREIPIINQETVPYIRQVAEWLNTRDKHPT